MMQKSITSFFVKKDKKPESPKKSPTNSPKECLTVSPESTPKKSPPRALSKSPQKSPAKESPVKTPNKKRPVSEWDSEDEDDEVVQKTRSSKRCALESPKSSPKKGLDSLPKSEITITPAKNLLSTTPAKSIVNPLMQQSPLMNPSALIKMKISKGAFALNENIGHTWFKALQPEFDKPYFKKLSDFVKAQRQSKTVFPPEEQVYTWTHFHAIKDTRVVIIGQDPYHGPNQAHGLSFSVQKGVAIPKSLQNIYKELQNDIENFKSPGHGNLTGWSKQGVLMLNACLTVNKGEPNSHQGKGWENFTDAVISWISKNAAQNVVFLLWGRFAQKKSSLIGSRHKILTSAHPSPFSADNGFFGCKHFSQTNAYLRSQKLTEIDWAAL